MRAAGWSLAALTGLAWGMLFFSWGLPLPLAWRPATTILLVAVLSAASRDGRLAASAFLLGMAASSALLLASSGLLFVDWYGWVPFGAAVAGLSLLARVPGGSSRLDIPAG